MIIHVAESFPPGEAVFRVGNQQVSVGDVRGGFVFQSDNAKIYLQGQVYYWLGGDKPRVFSTPPTAAELQQAFASIPPEGIPERVEGSYWGLWVDEHAGRAVVFGDYFNRQPVFYASHGREWVFATRLTDVLGFLDQVEYDPLGLYSYLLLGYTPLVSTLYSGVHRMGCDEQARISQSGVELSSVHREVAIRHYDESDLDRYAAYLENAVRARSGESENIIMSSGGWDSTLLVGHSVRDRDPKTVRAAVIDIVLADGRSFNIYEVDKVRRIAEFYGSSFQRVVVNHSDRGLLDLWERRRGDLRDHGVYFWVDYLKLADEVGSSAGPGAAVLSGEASDSIHNFGFSQFVSVNYEAMGLREYADKAKSYLYGPTFLAKIQQGTFASDEVYLFFRHYYGADRFEDVSGLDARERTELYLQSFMLSYPRVPFARWQNTASASERLRGEYARHLHTSLLGAIAERLRPDTLYYWLLTMYRVFHFQSAQIRVTQPAFGPHATSCRMPFLDLQMMQFAYSMPEDWGRGLELRTTKYPLRQLARERWRMPLHILEEAGPHSYIAENDTKWSYAGGQWSIHCEVLYNSVFAPYFKDVLRSTRFGEIFDSAFYRVKAMQAIVDKYVEGVVDPGAASLLTSLALLASVGLLRSGELSTKE